MALTEDEIINRVNKFFDKEKLDLKSKYFLVKQLEENYWQDIQSEGEEEEPEEELEDEDVLGEDEVEEDAAEEETSVEDDDLDDLDSPPKKPKKELIKKPKVKARKP